MKDKEIVLDYSEISGMGVNSVGNKALNIAKSEKAGFLVAPGIVLPVAVFNEYLQNKNMDLVYKTIQNKFLPEDMIIIRSSSIDEDQSKASFAGQYRSIICENNFFDIKKSCQLCWDSCLNPEVDSYRKIVQSMSGNEIKPKMALLIQRMIRAESSGVCFSQDPINGQKSVQVINAVYGLCESLVNEEVFADYYEINSKNKKVIKQKSGNQSYWRAANDHSQLSVLPDELKKEFVLDTLQIEEVSKLADKVEKFFSYPVDIEWAFEAGKLFLIQVRPITTVLRIQEDYVLWNRDNVADVIPDAVTPFTWSVVNKATNQGFRSALTMLGLKPKSQDLFSLFNGRAYCNQTAFRQIYGFLKVKRRNFFNIIKALLAYAAALFCLPFVTSKNLKQFAVKLNKVIILPEERALKGLRKFLETNMKIHIRVAVFLEIGTLILRGLMKKNVAQEKENQMIYELSSGLGAIASTDSTTALRELAILIKKETFLLEKIKNSSKSLSELVCGYNSELSEKWHDFFEKFGHQSLNEFELFYPRWEEDHSFVESSLKLYIENDEGNNFAYEQNLRRQKRIAAEKKILSETPLFFYFPIKFYMRHIQRCSIWRETIKQNIVKTMFQIRKQALSLAQKKQFKTQEDIFFITLDEVCEKSFQVDQQTIDRRRRDWDHFSQEEPFSQIRVYESSRVEKIPCQQSQSSSLMGLSLSSGSYRGVARVIIDKKDADSFKSGEVLVIGSTNPSWTPLFALAGAIVTDMGNYLSHGAIISRELGIPAVGNLFTATKKIKNGQKLFVDADKGIVHILEGV